MALTKMSYGLDLGTTNSAICRIVNGEPVIIKTDTQKDTLPSCISCTKRGIRVGDTAYNDLRMDRNRATKTWAKGRENVFIEFKRTMGLDTQYESVNAGRAFTSEELSAEVLKTLKSFVANDNVQAAVITIPAKFKADQIAATKRAAQLAGIDTCELLQEPIAASMAYGLSAEQKDGHWLVFDFGGGTFDAALLHVKEGIMQVMDTEGDNYLGGKNLDYAIVDGVIIPYLQKNFAIDEILDDDERKNILRDAMKFYAEQAKNQLSFKDSVDIVSQVDEFGEDDEGEPLELDFTITAQEVERVLSPIFQKAIDIVNDLLERNNMSGNDLDSLILVGGPTFSPILRGMLKKQVTQKIDFSIDPMTAVAKGAALFASGQNYEVSEIEHGVVPLNIEYESNTVEDMQFVTVSLQKNGTGIPPLYVEMTRADKGWSSGKIAISDTGEVFECQLKPGRANAFTVTAYDGSGNQIPCFPVEISIMQGIVIGNAVLPYHIGIEAENVEGKRVFVPLKGLEKNKPLPAVGIKNTMKVPRTLRPGMSADYFRIPVYQGEYNAKGTSAVYNDHVFDVIISGDDVPELIPADSEIDVALRIDASQLMTMEVTFLGCSEIVEKAVEVSRRSSISETDLETRMNEATDKLNELRDRSDVQVEELRECEALLNDVENRYDGEKTSEDGRMHLLADMRRAFLSMEHVENNHEWDSVESELREEFGRLESANATLGNKRSGEVESLRRQIDAAIRKRDVHTGRALLENVNALFFDITKIYQIINLFENSSGRNFDASQWKNPVQARRLLNDGMAIIAENPDEHQLLSILRQLIPLMTRPESDLIKL